MGKKNKKRKAPHITGLSIRCLLTLHSGEAFAAIYRAVFPGQERNLGFGAAIGADSVMHFTRGIAVVTGSLASLTAIAATGGFILETLFSVEFLFTSREDEFLATVTAYQRFVLIHFDFPLINMLVSVG